MIAGHVIAALDLADLHPVRLLVRPVGGQVFPHIRHILQIEAAGDPPVGADSVNTVAHQFCRHQQQNQMDRMHHKAASS